MLKSGSSPDVSCLHHHLADLLQPHLERIAVEALQICCLLLPPPNRRKIQLLMRMISRISENVDMPRLHDAMGTRSLVREPRVQSVWCFKSLEAVLRARAVFVLEVLVSVQLVINGQTVRLQNLHRNLT